MSQPASRDNREAEGKVPPGVSAPDKRSPAPSTAGSAAPDSPQTSPGRRPQWLVWLSIFGPGIIAAAAGNDAGGIATYSQAGAQYGLSLLWCLALITVGLIVVQEMCSRMGAVTGKGLAGLIRENFGVKVTLFSMIALVLANFALIVSEFCGITAVGEMFLGPSSRFYIIPAAMVVIWLLVSRGSYQKVERVFIVASGIFVTYIITAFRIGVPWKQVMIATFVPMSTHLHFTQVMIAMVVALIGTTISPYMQFYQQAAVRDKGITMKEYGAARLDTVVGSTMSNIVAAFIIIACAGTIYLSGNQNIQSAADAAKALVPLAGKFASLLFAFGLLNASLMAAVVVPLSTAYAVTEALGWESGLGRRIRELPLFYGTYLAMIVCGGLLVMALPVNSNLIQMIIGAQAVNCILLPVELVLMLLLVNRRRVMGKHCNGFWGNVGGWVTAVIACILSVVYLVWHPS